MVTMNSRFVRWFSEVNLSDVALVGGKNASLGELYRELTPKGIAIPNGFAVTADAYRAVLSYNDLDEQINNILRALDTHDLVSLKSSGNTIRSLIRNASIPEELAREIGLAYQQLSDEYQGQYRGECDLAVRSSATAEDLPDASFAGQHDSFLNVRGLPQLLNTTLRCFASLFNNRAISYRVDKGFDHMSVALSVGMQKMVRSDEACSGVMFSIDPESGFRNTVLINGVYGLGESIVQGRVNPDEFYVFKPTLEKDFRSIISKTLGAKESMLIYSERDKQPTREVRVPAKRCREFVISDDEVLTLAKWACIIEKHYSEKAGHFTAMDMEWAKDGPSGKLFIVQARPETVVSGRDLMQITQFKLNDPGKVLVFGNAVGQRIGAGPARIIHTPQEIERFKSGEVLVTDTTDPDWEPIMKRAKAIVTEKGGRTSHAAIVSRELGIPCIVGATHAMDLIGDGNEVTVSCAEGFEGRVYAGRLPIKEETVSLKDLPRPKTKLMLNVGNPENAFELSFLPNDGVGLARLEFIINSYIKIHPRALLEFDSLSSAEEREQIASLTSGYSDKAKFFVDKLAEGVARIAAAFYPKQVIVRMSDFKSNEYAHLLGGADFEPLEHNPMIGWRGASRYYSKGYSAGFALECQAMKKVREDFGLSNLKLMIPFCRTPAEGKKVLAEMEKHGLKRGEGGLEVYIMCEIPSNVILAEQFLQNFDGMSIGSNDLTQLTLGIDRDSSLLADLFDERNEAVKCLIEQAIKAAHQAKKHIGICGDAPSTYPDFAEFLVDHDIDSLSLSPDALLSTWFTVAKAEENLSGGLGTNEGTFSNEGA
jgi:pyruvate,water dikinase